MKVFVLMLMFVVLMSGLCFADEDPFQFKLEIIDSQYGGNGKPGWSRMGDMDQDGMIDVVAGGGGILVWYKNPEWKAQIIGKAGANGGVLYDIDHDGDLDIVSSSKAEKNITYWYENPMQSHLKDTVTQEWKRHIIDNSSGLTFQHDVETGDIDMDGTPDDFVVLYDDYRTKSGTIKWYKTPANPRKDKWAAMTISSNSKGGVGLAIADINGDGRNDVVRGGKWYRSPKKSKGKWKEYVVIKDHLSNVRAADLDHDGDMDIVGAAGWQDKGVLLWAENLGKGKRFTIHKIATLIHPENLVIIDLDMDGHLEIITGEMKDEDNSTMLVFENHQVKNDRSWKMHTMDQISGISARMNAADVDRDGDLDIVCDGNVQNHIYLWINQSERRPPEDDIAYEYFLIDTVFATGFVKSGDMDNDGDMDIVAGGGRLLYVYENPGNARNWIRHGTLDATKEIGCNGAVLMDADRDGDLDVMAARYNKELGWWENPGKLMSDPWTYHLAHDVEDGYYAHDIALFDLNRDGKSEEVLFNLNKDYWDATIDLIWLVPGKDAKQLWTKHVVVEGWPESFHGHAGIDTADLNRDGKLDLAYANGWFEAPKNENGTWIWHEISQIYGISNTLFRDINGDGLLDMVMSAGHYGRGVYWYENPGNPVKGTWIQHTVDPFVHHPEGLQVHDMDRDGDMDIFSAELFFGKAPGEPHWKEWVHNLYCFRNINGKGTQWVEINVAPNKLSTHQFQTVDVNQDGKLDMVTEGCGAPGVIYIENTSRLKLSKAE